MSALVSAQPIPLTPMTPIRIRSLDPKMGWDCVPKEKEGSSNPAPVVNEACLIKSLRFIKLVLFKFFFKLGKLHQLLNFFLTDSSVTLFQILIFCNLEKILDQMESIIA